MLRMRSPIFVPGNQRRMLEKAAGFETDFVVADLEDSVPPNEKDNARSLVSEMIPSLVEHGQHVMVRINSLDTGLSAADINAVVSDRVEAVSVGKITTPEDVLEYDRLLSVAERKAGVEEGRTRLVLWLENGPAVHNGFEIATASPRVDAVTFGAEDYTSALGIQRSADGGELYFPRAMVALAAHAAGVTPLDTPHVNFRDMEALEREVKTALQLGFKGKFAIHPGQLGVIRSLFGPQPEEVAHARRVVEGWDKAQAEGRGSFALDGNVIDIPVVERARGVLAEAEAQSAG